MNFQLPFNALGPINHYRIQMTDALHIQHQKTLAALHQCYGFTLAMSADVLQPFMQMMHLSELKSSFELEGQSVAYARIFEAHCSAAKTTDKTIQQINAFKLSLQADQGLKDLEPEFLRTQQKTADLYRNKSDQKIVSYYTNLCLYTPPTAANVLDKLKADLHQHLLDPVSLTTLQQHCISHFQLRALAPFISHNGALARQYAIMALSGLGLSFSTLPLSACIYHEREIYNSHIRQGVVNQQLDQWFALYLTVLEQSVIHLQHCLQQYLMLRKSVAEQIGKYIDYVLPTEALVKVLFEQPYISTQHVCKGLNCHRHTAYLYLEHLCKMGILIPKKAGRETLYWHKAYFDLLVSEPLQ